MEKSIITCFSKRKEFSYNGYTFEIDRNISPIKNLLKMIGEKGLCCSIIIKECNLFPFSLKIEALFFGKEGGNIFFNVGPDLILKENNSYIISYRKYDQYIDLIRQLY